MTRSRIPDLAFTHALIQLRTGLAALAAMDKETMEVLSYEEQRVLCVRRWSQDEEAVGQCSTFGDTSVSLALPVPAGHWDNARPRGPEEQWQGRGSSLPLLLLSTGECDALPPTMVVLFVQRAVMAH